MAEKEAWRHFYTQTEQLPTEEHDYRLVTPLRVLLKLLVLIIIHYIIMAIIVIIIIIALFETKI